MLLLNLVVRKFKWNNDAYNKNCQTIYISILIIYLKICFLKSIIRNLQCSNTEEKNLFITIAITGNIVKIKAEFKILKQMIL